MRHTPTSADVAHHRRLWKKSSPVAPVPLASIGFPDVARSMRCGQRRRSVAGDHMVGCPRVVDPFSVSADVADGRLGSDTARGGSVLGVV